MQRNIVLSTVSALLFVIVVTAIVIFFARGYTFNPKTGAVSKTGIMVVTSEPRDAAVYLDDKLNNTTNTTLNFLTPGKYKVRITKDGLTPWEKEVQVKPELVTRLDITLFPQVPDLRRLTLTGVKGVYTTPDGRRMVYRTDEKTKRGLWVMNLTDPAPFFNNDPIQIYKDTALFDMEKATYLASPDNKQLLVTDTTKPEPVYYLLDLERVNDNLLPQGVEDIETILLGWHDTLLTRERNLRQALVESVRDIPAHENSNPDISELTYAIDSIITQAALSGTAVPLINPTPTPTATPKRPGQPPEKPRAIEIQEKINFLTSASRWSPKQNKVIYQAGNQTKLYDLTTGRTDILPQADSIAWFPTNIHVILVNPNGKKGEIVISDYDGQNQIVIFSGQFVGNIAIPWQNGSKMVVLTNLNQAGGTDPNLYAINLR